MRENESDPHFWENFYRDVYPEVLSLTAESGVDPDDTEDVATEVCLRMFCDMKEGKYGFFSRPTSYVREKIRAVVLEGFEEGVDREMAEGAYAEARRLFDPRVRGIGGEGARCLPSSRALRKYGMGEHPSI